MQVLWYASMTELAENYWFLWTAVPSKSIRPVVILLQQFAQN